MRALVVIDDGLIFSMLNDPAFNTTIPCLFGKREIFKNATGGCSSCAKKKQDNRRQEMMRIKACLAGLSDEKRKQLKQLFNAERVRVMYSDAAGQIIQVNF
jgi:hypothetical protein